MESILVKKLPSLSGQDGFRGAGGGKKSKATALLERIKWGYLQPKLQLLRSNLDRLKSTLLLMLNVITYARQVTGKSVVHFLFASFLVDPALTLLQFRAGLCDWGSEESHRGSGKI